MNGGQVLAIVAVLLGAVLLGSFGAVLGFVAGVLLGYLVWGRRIT